MEGKVRTRATDAAHSSTATSPLPLPSQPDCLPPHSLRALPLAAPFPPYSLYQQLLTPDSNPTAAASASPDFHPTGSAPTHTHVLTLALALGHL